jgi:hypothetical protein
MKKLTTILFMLISVYGFSQSSTVSATYVIGRTSVKAPLYWKGTDTLVSKLDTASLKKNGSFTKFQYKKLQDIKFRAFGGNVLIGVQAGLNISSGQDNMMIGTNTGLATTTQNSNVYIGSASGYTNTGENNIFIGQASGYSMINKSNRLIIGSLYQGTILKDTTYNIIYGIQHADKTKQKLYFNASLYQNGELRDSANTTTSGFMTKFQYNKLQSASSSTGAVKLASFYTDASTSGAGATTLYSYTLPANTMTTNGDCIKAEYTISGTSSSSNISIYFGTNYITTSSVDVRNAMTYTVSFYRVSSSAIRIIILINQFGYNSTVITDYTSSVDFTSTNDIILKAQTAANAVTARSGLIVKY